MEYNQNEIQTQEKTEMENTNEKRDDKERITITTHIDETDLYYLNMYIIDKNKNISSIIFGIVFIVWAIWDICLHGKQGLIGNIIICILGVLFVLYALFFYKMLMIKKVKKLDLQKLEPIEVTIDDEGILYELESEKEEKYTPYAWNLVSKAVESDYYIYIHLIDKRTILFIRKKDITNDLFLPFLKGKISKYKMMQSKHEF